MPPISDCHGCVFDLYFFVQSAVGCLLGNDGVTHFDGLAEDMANICCRVAFSVAFPEDSPSEWCDDLSVFLLSVYLLLFLPNTALCCYIL